MKLKYRDDSFRVYHPYSRTLYPRGTAPNDYIEGEFITPHHTVLCYAQDGCSYLELGHGGRQYSRRFDVRLTPRQLAIYAGKFSREIAALKEAQK